MDNITRLNYLEAMGIDVWVTRKSHQVTTPLAIDQVTVQMAEQQADQSSSKQWVDLEKSVSVCEQCNLCQTRTQTVFGAGDVKADWMLIGEAPGQQEDLAGQPFVGPAGVLLTEMIRAIGLKREQVYIANIIKCRPPNNRNPNVEEIKQCNDHLQQQIALVKPKIILAVGRIAAQTLLNTKEPLAKLRGITHQLNSIPLVVVYHPAYLLRSLIEKRKAWQDLQLAIKTSREINNNESMESIR